MESLANFNPQSLARQEPDGINPFKSKMVFVGKNARIMKSMGGMKSAKKPDLISKAQRGRLLLHKKEQVAFHGDAVVFRNNLLSLDEKLRSSPCLLRRAIDRSFYLDSIRTDKTGDVMGREFRMEIALHRDVSEQKEASECEPRSPTSSF